MKMISSEDKEEWLKETYEHLQKLKEDKYGDVKLDYIMLYELHEEEHKEIERLNNKIDKSIKYIIENSEMYDEDLCTDVGFELRDLLNILTGGGKYAKN